MTVVRFQGVALNDTSLCDLSELITHAALSGEGITVSFVNPHSFNLLRRDPTGRFACDLAALDQVIADGVGVTLFCRLLAGRALPRYGFDLLAPILFNDLAAHDVRVFLLGANVGIAEKAAESLTKANPGMIVAGTHHGYMSLARDLEGTAQMLRDSGARVVCLSMGAPRQEAWAIALAHMCPSMVFVTCGGYLDQVIRPHPYFPAWSHSLGLNWLIRLIREPRRLWRRSLLGSIRFVWDTVIDSLCGSKPTSSPNVEDSTGSRAATESPTEEFEDKNRSHSA